MDSFVKRVAGVDYKFTEVAQFRCENCLRVTVSGSCGCSSPSPVNVGNTFYGTPVDGRVHAIDE